jgi:hypothetical protein
MPNVVATLKIKEEKLEEAIGFLKELAASCLANALKEAVAFDAGIDHPNRHAGRVVEAALQESRIALFEGKPARKGGRGVFIARPRVGRGRIWAISGRAEGQGWREAPGGAGWGLGGRSAGLG